MAEDQGVDGDRWNDQATVLLQSLNWESLGDSNIDLPYEINKKHGIDRLFKYLDSRRSSNSEGVLVEAKHYKTTSFSPKKLEEWIRTLDAKLTNVKNSGDFIEKFPDIDGVPLRSGLIVIWFHDVDKYRDFKPKFWEESSKIKLSRSRAAPNKIYVLDNDAILKLASLVMAVREINGTTGIKRDVQFYYPSIDTHSAKRSDVLNLNYMVSKFILADFVDSSGVENKVVFFFSQLTMASFKRLQHALSIYGYLDKDKPLIIYTYLRDDSEFRKIKPDVIKLFKDTHFSLEEMESFIDLPKFMRNS